jgi:hypothetical protein
MSGIATGTALAIGTAASAGTSIVGGLLAKSGAESQAQAAERSSAAAIAEQRRQFDITQQNMRPWLVGGQMAWGRLLYEMGLAPGVPGTDMFGKPGANQPQGQGQGANRFQPPEARGAAYPFMRDAVDAARGIRPVIDDGGGQDMGGINPTWRGPGQPLDEAAQLAEFQKDPDFGRLNRDFTEADFVADPAYQRRIDEGMKLLDRSASARGGINSGAAGKALVRFGQEEASDEWARSRARFKEDQRDRYNRYAGIAGAGQQTGQYLGGLGAEYARNVGDITIGGATAAGAARAAGSAALGQGIAGAGQGFMNWYLANRLLQQPGSSNGWV